MIVVRQLGRHELVADVRQRPVSYCRNSPFLTISEKYNDGLQKRAVCGDYVASHDKPRCQWSNRNSGSGWTQHDLYGIVSLARTVSRS